MNPDPMWCLQALYRRGNGEPVYDGLFEELKGQMKQTQSPDFLFEKDFLFFPMCLPCHWALAVVCNPLALVKKLLGLPSQVGLPETAVGSMAVVKPEPAIIFLDSLGSKGNVWCTALAHLLVQARQATQGELTHGTQLPSWSGNPQHVPRPSVDSPLQTNLYSCGDHLLVATRRVCQDVVRPLFDGKDTVTIQHLEEIIDREWYSADEVNAERRKIKDRVESLRAEEDCSQVTDDPEAKAVQEHRDRNRRLREQVQDCLASFENPNDDSSVVTVQQVVISEYCF